MLQKNNMTAIFTLLQLLIWQAPSGKQALYLLITLNLWRKVDTSGICPGRVLMLNEVGYLWVSTLRTPRWGVCSMEKESGSIEESSISLFSSLLTPFGKEAQHYISLQWRSWDLILLKTFNDLKMPPSLPPGKPQLSLAPAPIFELPLY